MTKYEQYVATAKVAGMPVMSEATYNEVRAQAIASANAETRRRRESCMQATSADIYGGDTDAHY